MERDIVQRLRQGTGPIKPNLIDDAADTIERLIAERDEARRMWCEQESRLWDEPATKPPEYFATEKGWHCFKEDGK